MIGTRGISRFEAIVGCADGYTALGRAGTARNDAHAEVSRSHHADIDPWRTLQVTEADDNCGTSPGSVDHQVVAVAKDLAIQLLSQHTCIASVLLVAFILFPVA